MNNLKCKIIVVNPAGYTIKEEKLYSNEDIFAKIAKYTPETNFPNDNKINANIVFGHYGETVIIIWY
jgi:hypothetical protein